VVGLLLETFGGKVYAADMIWKGSGN
jgi:hypothetical protein